MNRAVEPAAASYTGLTSAEAQARAAAGQANAVAWVSSRSFKRIVFDNAGSPINIALFAISIVLLGLGLFGDAFLTAGLVVGNVAAGVFQEARAKRQLDRIALLHRPLATVIRDGRERELAPEQIVLGDYLILRPGEQVFVDGRLVSATGLGIDESLLTGESDVVNKGEGNDVVSGTYCLTGSGVYEATRVGADTTANEITLRARQHRAPQTPLQREVSWVLWVMSAVVVLLGFTVARSFQQAQGGVSLNETVRAAAVIVALVPQGLAVMVTVSYGMAAVRMAGSGVLIQHMNAVESISHVNVLCLDKTGTLTTNRLTIEQIKAFTIDEGRLKLLLGYFAASASFRNHTADAIQQAFQQPEHKLKDEVAFDSSRKWSGMTFDDAGLKGAYVLGAPDVMASHVKDAAGYDLAAEDWTQRGFRVLLFAVAEDAEGFAHAGGVPQLPSELKPLGLVVLRDETRADAADVISEFARTGIDLKVISGDHPETVAALASQAGLPFTGEPASGPELDALDDAAFAKRVNEAAIFGRISPNTKERIVSALRRSGHYVAMIGDGVNDVPALKSAHVAVGLRSGSGITRDIADMVLLDDAFSSLPRAFQEGQRIRRGMESIFRIFLTRTVSLTLIILAVSLLDDPFPVTPRHTALIAMLTVGIPSLFLAVWAKPGRTWRLVILSGIEFVVPAGIGIAAVGLIAFEFFLSSTGNIGLSQSALTFTAVGCGLLVILFLEPPTPFWAAVNQLSGDWRPTVLAAGMGVLLIVVLVVPVVRRFYEVDLPTIWGFLVIGAMVVAWTVTLRAFWRLRVTQRLRRLLGMEPSVDGASEVSS